ncbi:MAG: TonB-dependent receptor plug domain-containing protein, partial [Bacteroidaceae bacterium]|nr:TonB-dependent receptor plug domain-containing protein [Bacteroidaceae bacterium]
MKKIFAIFLVFPAITLYAQKQDSLHVTKMKAVEVVSTVKEGGNLREQPSSVSSIDAQRVEDNHITSLKGISTLVPNLYIPDYGSRLTSAVYIRGIGSRMNESAVGMYVDNMPFADKSSFDFNLSDIERIDVLRGPQGTLYGRNAMGGIVKVYTRNPMFYQGTTMKIGYVSRESRRLVSLTHYHRPSRRVAFSAGLYYNGTQGLFRNDITGEKVDDANTGGAKARLIYLPTDRLSLDFNVMFDYTSEGAYPYYYLGAVPGSAEQFPDYIGKITNNHRSTYRRSLLNAGLKLDYRMKNVTMTSVTSYQWLNDRMFMDQDFVNADIYTL